MEYQIVIKKIEKVQKTDRTYHQIADTGNERDNGPVYGYVEHPAEETVESEIYKQKTDKEIDLKGVIDAFNKIKETK